MPAPAAVRRLRTPTRVDRLTTSLTALQTCQRSLQAINLAHTPKTLRPSLQAARKATDTAIQSVHAALKDDAALSETA